MDRLSVSILVIFALTWKLEAAYLGCYKDQATRDLDGKFTDQVTSAAACNAICSGFTYFGLQYGQQCLCGDHLGTYGKAPEADCNLQCKGNPSQTCGGTWRNSVFDVTSVKSGYIYVGCFVDQASRDLNGQFTDAITSASACAAICKDYDYFGLQYGQQCLCGDRLGLYGQAPDSDCNMKCNGNPSQTCGGNWRNSVYQVAVAPRPNADRYVGCFVDQAVRDLNAKFLDAPTSSTACGNMCKGFTYFGLQYGHQCFCGDRVGSYGQAPESDCNTQCTGGASEICGGTWRNSVFQVEASPPFSYSDLYEGCYIDQAVRDLNGIFTANIISAVACRSICQGFTYFGLQYGSQCLCGNRLGLYGEAPESDCNMRCNGNQVEVCGGNWRNSVFRVEEDAPKPAPKPQPKPAPGPIYKP